MSKGNYMVTGDVVSEVCTQVSIESFPKRSLKIYRLPIHYFSPEFLRQTFY